MTEYSFPEHYADDVLSAIRLAEELKKSGKYDLFRGQRHTFDIRPSVARLGVDLNEARKQLNDFARWVHKTPDLQSMHNNENAILAVAQHYGLKTPLLDFSRSPRVAGFFAQDGATEADTGTIICLNKELFTASWCDLNNRHLEFEGSQLTELINIDVKNLWRLHAQDGEFLRCHVDPDLLEMFSHFLHIYFPQKSKAQILHADEIYPTEKSHLEVMLDQYFLISSYGQREEQLKRIFGTVITIPQEAVESERKSFFKALEPPQSDPSWLSEFAMMWHEEPDENYRHTNETIRVSIIFPQGIREEDFDAHIEGQLPRLTEGSNSSHRPNMAWTVVDELDRTLYIDGEGITLEGNGEFTEFAVQDMVSTIYSGMRYLPYSDSQIFRAIVRYLKMLLFGVYELIDDCEGIELSGREIRGRGFASRQRVIEALRDDFLEHIDSRKLDSSGRLDFRDTLFAAGYVKSCYQFDRFIELFVEDLIPSQAVVAVEGLVIGLNPIRIDVFGES
ncbi:MAG: FRG domain-containing protein [Pseudomonadota bacterium]